MAPYGPATTQIKICGFPNVCQILLETGLAGLWGEQHYMGGISSPQKLEVGAGEDRIELSAKIHTKKSISVYFKNIM